MQIPEEVYNLIYQHLFRLTCLPDIKDARSLLAKQRLKFKDSKGLRSFVGFQAEFVSDVRWTVSQEGHVNVLAMDTSWTMLIDCSYTSSTSGAATTNQSANQDFCFRLPSAMSILGYDDVKRSTSRQIHRMNFTSSQLHIAAGAAKGFLPLLNMNDPAIGLPDTMPESIAATVSSFEMHKAVLHCFKYAEHLTLEYKESHITVSGDLQTRGGISIDISCVSSSANCWRQEFHGKMLCCVAKAFHKYYPKSRISLELRKDYPLILKVDDGDFCSKVVLAPYTKVETNDSNDDNDVDPEPI